MEPVLPNIPNVPVPQALPVKKEFSKSQFIVFLAYLELCCFLVPLIFVFMGSFGLIILMIPAVPGIIVIFAGDKELYRVAETLLIIECSLLLLVLSGVVYSFLNH